jgi:hypothetical protein
MKGCVAAAAEVDLDAHTPAAVSADGDEVDRAALDHAFARVGAQPSAPDRDLRTWVGGEAAAESTSVRAAEHLVVRRCRPGPTG